MNVRYSIKEYLLRKKRTSSLMKKLYIVIALSKLYIPTL